MPFYSHFQCFVKEAMMDWTRDWEGCVAISVGLSELDNVVSEQTETDSMSVLSVSSVVSVSVKTEVA